MAEEYLLLEELDDSLMCPICHDVAINPVQEQKCGKLFCSKCKEKLDQRLNCNCEVVLMAKEYFLLKDLDDSLMCPICHDVAINPVQEQKCGKLFCSKCKDKLDQNTCPCCKRRPNYFEDTRSDRDVKALSVKCNSHLNGCHWQGTIGTLDQHLDKCDYAILECPNDCHEDNLLRKDLQHHMAQLCSEREYQCPDCSIENVYRVITGPHQDVCERKKVECENKECDCVLERRLVQDHVARDCDYTEVNCKYALLGCEKKMIRKDMKKHEEDHGEHLSLALKSIVDLKVLVFQLQAKERKLASIKVSDYSYKNRNNIKYKSESFFTSPSGYKMELWVYLNGDRSGSGTHLSLFLHILEGPFDSQLSWPLLGTFKFKLLNQLEDNNHHAQSLTFVDNKYSQCGATGGWGHYEFIEQSALTLDSSRNIQYLKDDTLYFQVFLEDGITHKHWLD